MPSLSHSPSTNSLNRSSPDASAAAAAGAHGADAAGSRNVLRSTPFASADAADAVQQQQEQQAEAVAGRRKQPELVAFILLDPMWENGEEVGYVSSIVRMKRSAHQGGFEVNLGVGFCIGEQGKTFLLYPLTMLLTEGLQQSTVGHGMACLMHVCKN